MNGVAGAVGITFPGTGAWTTWQTKTVRLTLAAGTNKIRARATTADGGPNADKLTVNPTSDDTQPPSAPANLAVSNIKSNAATFTWTAATDNVGVVRYEINRGGNVLKVVDANTLDRDRRHADRQYGVRHLGRCLRCRGQRFAAEQRGGLHDPAER